MPDVSSKLPNANYPPELLLLRACDDDNFVLAIERIQKMEAQALRFPSTSFIALNAA